ncbi:MAG: tRNA (adenosine(37)-N6)-dimethylallyltransferase MiaA [Pseudomonadota bacterium]|nr:tRNA (adenosine(37)-N6)-dimethylallyltransferase MiaA [Pseudomonadota bacterium]
MDKSYKPIVFLFGPTASGKTDLAIKLAKRFPVELISVDSVMVYKDCDIGSAKPNKNILEKYPHHLVDIVSPNEVFNVSDFCKNSKKIIEISHSKNKLPIFVGGSMMYLKSLYSGLYDLPERDQEFRESLKKLKSNENDYFLYKKLNQIDPEYAKKIHKNDEVRVIRALEIYEKTGRKMSEIFSNSRKNSLSDKFNIIQFCISIDREIIHERIKKRLIKIIELGLIDEAKKLLINYDLDLNHPIRRSVNYKQAFEFIEKKYDYETFFDKALFATRQLAKRQTTWIRSWNKFEEIDPSKPDNIINSVKKLITAL